MPLFTAVQCRVKSKDASNLRRNNRNVEKETMSALHPKTSRKKGKWDDDKTIGLLYMKVIQVQCYNILSKKARFHSAFRTLLNEGVLYGHFRDLSQTHIRQPQVQKSWEEI